MFPSLVVAGQLVFNTAKPRFEWKLPAFTAFVLSSYLAYYYYIEEPSLPPEPPPPRPLPKGAVKKLPDGRLLMPDGSIIRSE